MEKYLDLASRYGLQGEEALKFAAERPGKDQEREERRLEREKRQRRKEKTVKEKEKIVKRNENMNWKLSVSGTRPQGRVRTVQEQQTDPPQSALKVTIPP